MGQCVEVSRYQGEVKRLYFRADGGVANPELYAYLEVGGRMRAIKSRVIIVTSPSEKRLCSLLEAAASGDREAFRTLYDESAPVLFAICVRNRSQALR